jgi:lysophospholipase L1-like esterase
VVRRGTLAILGTVVVAFGALLTSGCSTNEVADDTSEETTTTANAPVSLSYVALGDSLAVGLGAYRGYVDRYADYIKTDTGAQVDVVNLGQSGETSSELLYALRNGSSLRRALSTANVITFNIGFNDLGRAREAYENGTCGGVDNQGCLRTAVETFEENWDTIIAELLSLRSTDDTIIRTAGLGYAPYVDTDEVLGTLPSNGTVNDFRVFEPYANEANRHIATTATNNGIPYAEVHLDKEDISPDGVHPNDEGYEIIADQLRELGYSPLGR